MARRPARGRPCTNLGGEGGELADELQGGRKTTAVPQTWEMCRGSAPRRGDHTERQGGEAGVAGGLGPHCLLSTVLDVNKM